METQVYGFERATEVGPSGHYALKNDTLATLRFSDVALERMAHFNHQNVLSSLELTAVEPGENHRQRINVVMHSSFGLETAFECTSCRVLRVRRGRVDVDWRHA